jgi:hypothetical protein
MNATIFVLFVLMKYDPNFLDFRTVKLDSLEQCEAARLSLKSKDEDIYKRSFCASVTRVFSQAEIDTANVPVEDKSTPTPEEDKSKPCVRKFGFTAGKPCAST